MRPDFGSGVMQLVFAPAGDALVAATEFTVQGALQRWLGHLIQVGEVAVRSEDGTLTVDIEYTLLRTGERDQASFTRSS